MKKKMYVNRVTTKIVIVLHYWGWYINFVGHVVLIDNHRGQCVIYSLELAGARWHLPRNWAYHK